MSGKILPAARENSKTNMEILQSFIFGSKEIHQRVLDIIKVVKDNFPAEELIKFTEMARKDQIAYAYKFKAVLMKHGIVDLFKNDEKPHFSHDFFPIELPGGVSDIMSKNLIRILATDEQIAKWMPLLDAVRVVCAYAQTELAHGSDVQSLQTTATLDTKTREWVINTPNVGAYKWWPGELANVANAAIVYCNASIDGKSIGVLPFIMYIRCPETHKPLPGIEVGDIGPKLGYFPKENGFLAFTNFRVPFDSLLARFFHVDNKNHFSIIGNEKIIYSSMLKVRICLLSTSALTLARACCIATRYSFIRKQFKDSNGQEIPIINYQLQQNKLFPLIAKSYVMISNYHIISKLIQQSNRNILQNKDFSLLQECHVYLAGAKSFYTQWCSNGLNVCMQSCGGHGYSQYSGIPYLIQTFAPNTILEGENTMLSLQVSRFLLKNYGALMSGKEDKIKGQALFMTKASEFEKYPIASKDKLKCRKCVSVLFQKLALQLIEEIGSKFAEKLGELDRLTIQNKVLGIKLFELGKIHTIGFSIENAFNYADKVEHRGTKQAIESLIFFFIYDMLIENANIFVSQGCITPEVLCWVRELYEEGLEDIKPDCLSLIDAFIPDSYTLVSAIAHDNEKPYENLYRWAKGSGALNQVDLITPYLDIVRKASLEAYPKL